jgi:formate/nitrite transporter
MAWASRLISVRQLLRNWGLVYAGNVAGALGTVAIIWVAGVGDFNGGDLGEAVIGIGGAKAGLSLLRSFALGVMCNALVCMAVWLAMGGRSVTDRILAIVFPITAFVAIGFEHSIANWFFLPYAIALSWPIDGDLIRGALTNLIAVTAGNIVGGTLLVAGVYWLAYLRKGAQPTAAT